MKDYLHDLPRVRINHLPTPMARLDRLSDTLGGPRILIKRDDLTGPALGGNKTRKLEFLLGDALRQSCDTVITGGAMQSNHSRQTAGAAAAVGLECHLALGGEKPRVASGNLLLDHLFGAVIHWCGEQTKGERIPEIAEQLRQRGRKPYVIPYGGSNTIGAAAFVEAIRELTTQLEDTSVDAIVIASASGGTHAGMTVGIDAHGLKAALVGIAVDRHDPGDPTYESQLASLANDTARMLGLHGSYDENSFALRYEYYGAGYAIMGNAEREAIRLVASCEGLILDPVYTGRAMAGLIDMVKKGEYSPDETVLFRHTGGTPAIFGYADEFAIERAGNAAIAAGRIDEG